MFSKSLSNGQERIMNDQLAQQLKALEVSKKVEANSFPVTNKNMPFEWPDKLTADQRILLGVGLQEIRKKKGFTQDTLSRRMGIDKQMICAIEGGKRHKVDRALINQFGHHLQTDMFSLMESVVNSDRVIPPHQRRSEQKSEQDPYFNPHSVNLGKLAPISASTIAPFPAHDDDGSLICDQDFNYRIAHDDFEFRLHVSNEEFHLLQKFGNNEHTIYKGSRKANNVFLSALKKMVSLIQ